MVAVVPKTNKQIYIIISATFFGALAPSSGTLWVVLATVINNFNNKMNHLHAELNPICHLLALLKVHRIFHVSRIRVK